MPGYKSIEEKLEEKEVMTTSDSGGKKATKLARFDLIPVGPLTELAKLYGKGAEKYSENNWRNGYDWSKSYSALCRHLNQFWDGENYDDQTKCHHLSSVIFHAMAMLEYSTNERYKRFDDRYSTILEKQQKKTSEEIKIEHERFLRALGDKRYAENEHYCNEYDNRRSD